FDSIARLALRIFAPGRSTKRTRGRRTRVAAAVGMMLAAGALNGCTTWRIVRYREPFANRPVSIFEQRAVRHADVPFRFAMAPQQRTDLDTMSVRDVDFRPVPFGQYAERR